MINVSRHRFFAVSAAALLSAALSVSSSAAFAQTFIPQGPSPSIGPLYTIQSNDAPPNGTVSGAIQALVPDPIDVATIYAGAVNGGVWVTRNNGASWTPLSDKQSSLSIGSLALDPTDATRKTLVAGIGITSNGRIGDDRGGRLTGILYSSNGGASWSELGGADLGGKNIVGVAARGATILAASADPHDDSVAGGLYRSNNGGASFQLVAGLVPGAVTALAADPANNNIFYAAVSATDPAQRGIYKSDIGGSTWTLVRPIAANEVARLATGSGGSLALAVFDKTPNVKTSNKAVGLFLSKDAGATWKSLDVPAINSGGQASTNLALAIDKTNPNVLYIAGDTIGVSPFTVPAFRVTLRGDGSTAIETIVDAGAADGSTTHADARVFTFDASGRLLMGSDGGVYARSNPQDASGAWTGLNNGLSTREIYAIAYDAHGKRLVVAAQDNGSAYQNAANNQTYTAVGGADGVNAAINDRTRADSSAIYTSVQYLDELQRINVDSAGNTLSTTYFPTSRGAKGVLAFANDDYSWPGEDGGPPNLPFFSRIALNRKDPTRIAFGTNYLYTAVDANIASETLALTNVGRAVGAIGASSGVSALAYGTEDDIDALLAGSSFLNAGVALGQVYYRSTASGGTLSLLAAYSGNAPTSVVFDNRAAARFFVADGAALFGSTNSGASFANLTANLTPLDIFRPSALEFIANNGVNALVVGGLVSAASAPSPLAVADSNGAGVLSNWRSFGLGLPNTFVSQLAYNPTVDVLAVSLFGRGAWLLYDVTSYFSTATVLRYGLADNDSSPDAAFLSGARPLQKAGTGRLTIAGNSTYTGITTIDGGTMVVNGSIASSSGLLVGPFGTLSGSGTVSSTVVNGTVAPGNPGSALSVAGNYTQNAGGTYRAAVTAAGLSDRLDVTGTAALNGTLAVAAGPGNYLPNRTYTLLNATGGVTGGFASVVSNYPFLLPTLGYGANSVSLSLAPGGFAQGGQTPNQRAIGAVLDNAIAGASGDFANVISALSLLSAAQAPAVFEQLSGQNYSAFATGSVQTAQLFMNNFAQQAGGGAAPQSAAVASGGLGRLSLAEACDVACDASAPSRWGVWGGAIGGVGTVAGDGASRGVNYNIGGFAAGLDRRFDPQFLAGVAVGYTSATQFTQGMEGRGTSDTVMGALYGNFTGGPFYVDGLAGYAHGENRLRRPIAIPGLATRVAYGQSGSDQFFGQVEGGYRIELGGIAEAFVTPFARLQASTTRQGGFTESGADSLNLTVAAQTTDSLRSVIGSQIGGSIDAGWREKLKLVARLGWSREFADTARPVTASFAGAPAQNFSVNGAAAPRDGAVLGLGASTTLADAVTLSLRYDGEVAGGNTSHSLSLGLRMTW